jgi:hypothetical protein
MWTVRNWDHSQTTRKLCFLFHRVRLNASSQNCDAHGLVESGDFTFHGRIITRSSRTVIEVLGRAHCLREIVWVSKLFPFDNMAIRSKKEWGLRHWKGPAKRKWMRTQKLFSDEIQWSLTSYWKVSWVSGRNCYWSSRLAGWCVEWTRQFAIS